MTDEEKQKTLGPINAPTGKKLERHLKNLQENEEAWSIYEQKQLEQPDLARPLVKEEKKVVKRNFTMIQTQKIVIDREKITDEQGREIALKKPSGDAIEARRPLKDFINAKEHKPLKKKIKKNQRSSLSINTSAAGGISQNIGTSEAQELLEGQLDTFKGSPIFREHYH